MWLSDKSSYVGNYKSGEKNGHGTYTLKGEVIYKGDWQRNLMHGKGTLKFIEDGRTYTGEFYRGRVEGFGIMNWSDGKIYEGEFKDGLREGYGVYLWSKG